ncbi:MAG: threonine synthase [Bacteroides sp. SM23_62]|nr:MAG: threonine synthase [Bacteroides sp. SM23_62]
MNYYSTENRQLKRSLKDAVLEGLAPDGGLFMPERIPLLTEAQIQSFRSKSFHEISRDIAISLFHEDLNETEIIEITDAAINFDTPLVYVEEGIYTLELFHGPTLAFKDVGARFMARMLGHFTMGLDREINVLVATSGDTGSAVASGFWNVEGIRVFILYPSGGVSRLQEKQLTTLGGNIMALEIAGTFDDCQRLVKSAFQDKDLHDHLILTSANSINLARLLPQSFYYFNAWARLRDAREFYVSVPSGNFGNLTAGLIAGKMGLPVKHYIVATNVNDVVPEYLQTGKFRPRPSIPTIANAMDVGNPSNFARILDLYGHSHDAIVDAMNAYAYTDDELRETIGDVYQRTGYLLDPHGAAGYRALKAYTPREKGIPGVFLETAHPGKFSLTVEEVIRSTVEIPTQLQDASSKKKSSITLAADFPDFKDFLLHL